MVIVTLTHIWNLCLICIIYYQNDLSFPYWFKMRFLIYRHIKQPAYNQVMFIDSWSTCTKYNYLRTLHPIAITSQIYKSLLFSITKKLLQNWVYCILVKSYSVTGLNNWLAKHWNCIIMNYEQCPETRPYTNYYTTFIAQKLCSGTFTLQRVNIFSPRQ